MDRMAWLEARKLYIGASDIAKLTGVAPASWGGPFSVWADKVQPVTEADHCGPIWRASRLPGFGLR